MGRLRLKNTPLRLRAAPGATHLSAHAVESLQPPDTRTEQWCWGKAGLPHTAPGTLPRLPRPPLWQRCPGPEAREKGRAGAARDRPNAAAIPAAAAASARCRLGWARLGSDRLGSARLSLARFGSAGLRASPGLCWVPAPAAPPVTPREGARAGCFLRGDFT